MKFPRQKPQLLSPLVIYALSGLEKCWMPGHGRWSHIYHLDGRTRPNESVPHSDAFYTLNVLLGMSRLPERPAGIAVAEIYAQNAVDLLRLPAAKYAYGMALWSAAELGLDVPKAVAQRVESLLSKTDNWHGFRAQDLGMLLAGVLAVLALATVGVMVWDQRATARAEQQQLSATELGEAGPTNSSGEAP